MMNKKSRLASLFVLALSIGGIAIAHTERDHDEKEHGEEEEGDTNVGPEKGILEASAEAGFKLSPQAIENFEIKTKRVTGTGPWAVPQSARLFSAEETNLYRFKDGYFKRIDFSQVKIADGMLTFTSKEIAPGDEIAVGGVGFLRIAELTAFGGAPEGHSH